MVAGFFIDGGLHSFNGVRDFVRFRPLSPMARARLGWFVALRQLRPSYAALEHIPLDRWLRRHCGAEVTERMWMPLLDSRFDGDHAELPATYMWRAPAACRARTLRSRREEMRHLVGGHQRLIEAAGTLGRPSSGSASSSEPLLKTSCMRTARCVECGWAGKYDRSI